MSKQIFLFFTKSKTELFRAINEHASINSAHEGYAVILEEVRELEQEVFKKSENRNKDRILEELIQISAMCARMAVDLNLMRINCVYNQ